MSSWKHYQQIRIIGRGSFGYVFGAGSGIYVSVVVFDPLLDFCPRPGPVRQAGLARQAKSGRETISGQAATNSRTL